MIQPPALRLRTPGSRPLEHTRRTRARLTTARLTTARLTGAVCRQRRALPGANLIGERLGTLATAVRRPGQEHELHVHGALGEALGAHTVALV